jgi:hypothetical protein
MALKIIGENYNQQDRREIAKAESLAADVEIAATRNMGGWQCWDDGGKMLAWGKTLADAIRDSKRICLGIREARRTPCTYWHSHPRGFANECGILRAETREQADALAADGWKRLTRAELARHIAWLNGEARAWGSNNGGSTYVLNDVLTSREYSAAYRI